MNPETVDIHERHDREPPWVSADPNITERLRATLTDTKVSRLRDPDDPEPYTYRVLLTNSAAERLEQRLAAWKVYDEQERKRVSAEAAQEAAERRKRRRVVVALAWALLAAAVGYAVTWGLLWWVTLPAQPIQDDFALVMGRLVTLAFAVFAGFGTYHTRKDR